jgi:hypothetical protein
MIVLIPAVPAFAGDLKLDEALGTRAIMECEWLGTIMSRSTTTIFC